MKWDVKQYLMRLFCAREKVALAAELPAEMAVAVAPTFTTQNNRRADRRAYFGRPAGHAAKFTRKRR